MPIYEYQCQSCGDRSEALQSVSAPPLETCTKCDGKLVRLISAPAVQFKGEGWYVTDYAKKGKDAKGGGKSGASSDAPSSSSDGGSSSDASSGSSASGSSASGSSSDKGGGSSGGAASPSSDGKKSAASS